MRKIRKLAPWEKREGVPSVQIPRIGIVAVVVLAYPFYRFMAAALRWASNTKGQPAWWSVVSALIAIFMFIVWAMKVVVRREHTKRDKELDSLASAIVQVRAALDLADDFAKRTHEREMLDAKAMQKAKQLLEQFDKSSVRKLIGQERESLFREAIQLLAKRDVTRAKKREVVASLMINVAYWRELFYR